MIQGSADLINDVLYAVGGFIRAIIKDLSGGLGAITGSLGGGASEGGK
ncbi:hypothetical protein ACTXKY_01145 [Corynebacterium variabile]|jgi:hypothetical protein